MKKLRFITSLVTSDNDYQREQAEAAQAAARRVGADLQILDAANDAVNQSQQLLKIIQGSASERPDAIICLPVGTGLAQVAHAAVTAGIGWAIINREVDYLGQLRMNSQVPSFCVTVDQEEVGRIESRQFRAILPGGGLVLYIAGPAGSFGSERRIDGMKSTKPANVDLRQIRGRWTEESGYKAVQAWLRLSTSLPTPISLVCGQNDSMALGACRAFEHEVQTARQDWAKIPFIGCDACGAAGKDRVRQGILAASIELPATAGIAIDTFARFYLRSEFPAERTLLMPVPFPPVESLAGLRTKV